MRIKACKLNARTVDINLVIFCLDRLFPDQNLGKLVVLTFLSFIFIAYASFNINFQSRDDAVGII